LNNWIALICLCRKRSGNGFALRLCFQPAVASGWKELERGKESSACPHRDRPSTNRRLKLSSCSFWSRTFVA
jgi:hypothetical protein